jgi:uncharacterized membrane protein YcgQ (UPF0703/DUF1980 family)
MPTTSARFPSRTACGIAFVLLVSAAIMSFTSPRMLLADPRVNKSITPEQAKMAQQIRKLCEAGASAPASAAAGVNTPH